MEAYDKANCEAISINTSYSDAVIPWLKSAGKAYFDFGSGNLNHLVPRIKFYIAEKYGIKNFNDIDVTIAVSHFMMLSFLRKVMQKVRTSCLI